MSNREHIWTIVFAVLFTLLIWLWAEGENRESSTHQASVVFVATNPAGEFRIRTPDPDNPAILASEIDIEVVVEGPNLALGGLNRNKRLEIPIENVTDAAQREVNLVNALRDLREFVDLGLTVTAVSPSRATLHVDQIERRSVPISTTIPAATGVAIQQITIDPAEVELAMSRRDWDWAIEQFGRELVYLDINPDSLRAQTPGVPVRRRDVRVRLQAQVAALDLMRFESPLVTTTITIEQQLEELADWPVPLSVKKPPRDEPHYEVSVDLEQYELITGVTLAGDADAIRRLRNNEIKVHAIIDLTSDELEQGITQKQVEWWLPEGIKVVAVNGVPGARPIIPIRIKPRMDEPDEANFR